MKTARRSSDGRRWLVAGGDVLDVQAALGFRWVVQIFGAGGYAAHYLLLMKLFGLRLVLLAVSCGKSSFARWGSSLFQSAAEGSLSRNAANLSTFGGYPKVSESPAISGPRPILVTLADDHGVQQQANKRAGAPVQAERLPRRIGIAPSSRHLA